MRKRRKNGKPNGNGSPKARSLKRMLKDGDVQYDALGRIGMKPRYVRPYRTTEWFRVGALHLND